MIDPFDLPVERQIITYDSHNARIVVSVRRRPNQVIPAIGGSNILPGRLLYTIPNGMILDTEDELVFTSPETDEVLREASLVDEHPAMTSPSVTGEGHNHTPERTAEDNPLLRTQEDTSGGTISQTDP